MDRNARRVNYLQAFFLSEERTKVCNHLHDAKTAGHLGQTRTLEKIKSRFCWYKMTEFIQEYCAACLPCASRKTTNHRLKAPLQEGSRKLRKDPKAPPQIVHYNRRMHYKGEWDTSWTEIFFSKRSFKRWRLALKPLKTAKN